MGNSFPTFPTATDYDSVKQAVDQIPYQPFSLIRKSDVTIFAEISDPTSALKTMIHRSNQWDNKQKETTQLFERQRNEFQVALEKLKEENQKTLNSTKEQMKASEKKWREHCKETETSLRIVEEELKEEKQKSNHLNEQIENLTRELKSYRVTRDLQNSGKIVNSETLNLLTNCNKLFATIESKCQACIFNCSPDVPDHYVYLISNAIFHQLFTQENTEKLLENSWAVFQCYAENETVKEELLKNAKRSFGLVVQNVIELYELVQSSEIPKIKLIWFGQPNSAEDQFDVKEKITLENYHGIKTVPVIPALAIGDSKIPERKGTVLVIE